MRYTLKEIRKMTSQEIQAKLDEAISLIVKYSVMNQGAAQRHAKNAERFERVLNERKY